MLNSYPYGIRSYYGKSSHPPTGCAVLVSVEEFAAARLAVPPLARVPPTAAASAIKAHTLDEMRKQSHLSHNKSGVSIRKKASGSRR